MSSAIRVGKSPVCPAAIPICVDDQYMGFPSHRGGPA
jgi:hypothetical protein